MKSSPSTLACNPIHTKKNHYYKFACELENDTLINIYKPLQCMVELMLPTMPSSNLDCHPTNLMQQTHNGTTNSRTRIGTIPAINARFLNIIRGSCFGKAPSVFRPGPSVPCLVDSNCTSLLDLSLQINPPPPATLLRSVTLFPSPPVHPSVSCCGFLRLKVQALRESSDVQH